MSKYFRVKVRGNKPIPQEVTEEFEVCVSDDADLEEVIDEALDMAVEEFDFDITNSEVKVLSAEEIAHEPDDEPQPTDTFTYQPYASTPCSQSGNYVPYC